MDLPASDVTTQGLAQNLGDDSSFKIHLRLEVRVKQMASMQTCPNQHIYSWRCCFTPHFQVFVHIFVCQCMNSTLYTLHTVSKGHLFRHEIHTTSSLTEDVVFCSGGMSQTTGKILQQIQRRIPGILHPISIWVHRNVSPDSFGRMRRGKRQRVDTEAGDEMFGIKLPDVDSLTKTHLFYKEQVVFLLGDVWVQ